MKSFIKKSRKIVLILNERESDWLKAFVQNPPKRLEPLDEDKDDNDDINEAKEEFIREYIKEN